MRCLPSGTFVIADAPPRRLGGLSKRLVPNAAAAEALA